MLSPQFKVRDFEVVDSFPYPVAICWNTEEGEAKDTELFERNNAVPSLKTITFSATRPSACRPSTPRRRCSPQRGSERRRVRDRPVPKCKEPEGKTKLKVAIRLNLNGLVSVESAQAVEEVEEEVVVPASAPAEGEEPPEGEPMETTKMVKKTIRTDVPVASVVGGLPAPVLETFVQEEYDMALQDRVMEETKERKNARRGVRVLDALEGCRRAGALRRAGGGEQFGKLLNDTEDWLYDEGEDETKGVYAASSRSSRRSATPWRCAAEERARPAAAEALPHRRADRRARRAGCRARAHRRRGARVRDGRGEARHGLARGEAAAAERPGEIR